MVSAITRINPRTLPDAASVGYSQISIAGMDRLAFVSGQVAWRRDGGAVPGTFSEQAQIVVENLSHALDAMAAGPHDIVQLRAYMTDVRSETLAIVMEKLGEFLQGAKPSLTGIGVAALATPELQLEIEMVVRVPH